MPRSCRIVARTVQLRGSALTDDRRASLAAANRDLAVGAVLAAGTLAACGGETTSSTSPSAASPNPAASHGEANPSATASAGPRMAVSYARPPGLPSPHAITLGTVGWKFKPTVDIKVTQLGCFDARLFPDACPATAFSRSALPPQNRCNTTPATPSAPLRPSFTTNRNYLCAAAAHRQQIIAGHPF